MLCVRARVCVVCVCAVCVLCGCVRMCAYTREIVPISSFSGSSKRLSVVQRDLPWANSSCPRAICREAARRGVTELYVCVCVYARLFVRLLCVLCGGVCVCVPMRVRVRPKAQWGAQTRG